MNAKKILRKQLLSQRQHLPISTVQHWNDAITSTLLQFPLYQQCDLLLTFVGSKDNEVDTLPIIQYSISRHKKVFLPIVLPNKKMAWCECNDIIALQRNQWGILEPPHHQSNQIATFSTTSCCLVPGIAFTSEGHRIGYGGGYFDRFLADFSGVSIGLCYDAMLQNNIPVESHDLAVDWIITESRCIKCNLIKNSSCYNHGL